MIPNAQAIALHVMWPWTLHEFQRSVELGLVELAQYALLRIETKSQKPSGASQSFVFRAIVPESISIQCNGRGLLPEKEANPRDEWANGFNILGTGSTLLREGRKGLTEVVTSTGRIYVAKESIVQRMVTLRPLRLDDPERIEGKSLAGCVPEVGSSWRNVS